MGSVPGWGLVQTGGGDPSGHGSSGMAKGWVFWCGVASVAEGRVSRHVWVRTAVAWHSLSGGEPSRMEQRLCSPMGQGFGRLAVLLLDHGVVKPSTI
jgi:hypothetical protein